MKKNVKFIKVNLLFALVLMFVFSACEKDSTDDILDDSSLSQSDDDSSDSDNSDNSSDTVVEITIGDLSSLSIDENPSLNEVISIISYTVINSNDTPTFSIVSQSISGAISVSGSDFVVSSVADFDYETNTSITGTIQASLGDVSTTANFTITINDVDEDTSNGGLTSFFDFFNNPSLPANMSVSNATTTNTSLSNNSLTWNAWTFGVGSVSISNTHNSLTVTNVNLESYLVLPVLDFTAFSEILVDGDVRTHRIATTDFDSSGLLQWVYSTDCTTCTGDSNWSVVPLNGICVEEETRQEDGPSGPIFINECFVYEPILQYWGDFNDTVSSKYDVVFNIQNFLNYLDEQGIDHTSVNLALRYTARMRDDGWVYPGDTLSISEIYAYPLN